jgi:hypothetical protein
MTLPTAAPEDLTLSCSGPCNTNLQQEWKVCWLSKTTYLCETCDWFMCVHVCISVFCCLRIQDLVHARQSLYHLAMTLILTHTFSEIVLMLPLPKLAPIFFHHLQSNWGYRFVSPHLAQSFCHCLPSSWDYGYMLLRLACDWGN